jgi:DNA-binding XRE family transcriptional regulator
MARRTLDTDKQLYEPDLCMGYAAFIRGGRAILGISQNSFAKMLGIHRTTLVRLEQGSPPLKRNLLDAAVLLLQKLGLQINAVLLKQESGNLTIPDLQVTIPIESLRQVQQLLNAGGSEEEFTHRLFGDQYVPPLKASPLRKKIPKTNT